jgi:hypothetical protein
MLADDVRVTDGKIPRCSANRRPRAASAQIFGVKSGRTKSARWPSQITNTARRIAFSPNWIDIRYGTVYPANSDDGPATFR